MNQFSSSAIERHRLQSILPHPFKPQSQIIKNKEFYRPEEFIWNNPHRTSSRVFQFYHAYNQHYEDKKAPLIKQQQERDRNEAEQDRIQRLTNFRNRTRQQFHQTQGQRMQLQSKTRHGSTATEPNLGIQSQIKKGRQSKTRTKLNSQKFFKTEQSYIKGIAKHDMRNQQVQRMIESQNKQFHSKIRSEFIQRKINNDSRMSYINKSKKTII